RPEPAFTHLFEADIRVEPSLEDVRAIVVPLSLCVIDRNTDVLDRLAVLRDGLHQDDRCLIPDYVDIFDVMVECPQPDGAAGRPWRCGTGDRSVHWSSARSWRLPARVERAS